MAKPTITTASIAAANVAAEAWEVQGFEVSRTDYEDAICSLSNVIYTWMRDNLRRTTNR